MLLPPWQDVFYDKSTHEFCYIIGFALQICRINRCSFHILIFTASEVELQKKFRNIQCIINIRTGTWILVFWFWTLWKWLTLAWNKWYFHYGLIEILSRIIFVMFKWGVQKKISYSHTYKDPDAGKDWR